MTEILTTALGSVANAASTLLAACTVGIVVGAAIDRATAAVRRRREARR